MKIYPLNIHKRSQRSYLKKKMNENMITSYIEKQKKFKA